MAAIFKSSLQNLSPLRTSLKVKPSFKPKTGLNFFVNTAKTLGLFMWSDLNYLSDQK